jgi:hypothetical protein
MASGDPSLTAVADIATLTLIGPRGIVRVFYSTSFTLCGNFDSGTNLLA